MTIPPTAAGTDSATTDVSIVIVNWNTVDLLRKLLPQLRPPAGSTCSAEVIVVDNASEDGSVAAVREAHPEVRLLPQTRNGGFAFGVNRGLEASHGRYVMLLNSDTVVQWEAIVRFLADADAHPDGMVFGPRVTDERGIPQRTSWRSARPIDYWICALIPGYQRHPGGPRDQEHTADNVSGCVFLIRRESLLRLGGLDERFFMYFEETDFCDRARRAGGEVWYLPGATFVHLGGVSANKVPKRTFRAYLESCLLYHVAWHGHLATEFVRLGWLFAYSLRLLGSLPLKLFGCRQRLGLFWDGVKMLLRPNLVATLARQPRQIPTFGGAAD